MSDTTSIEWADSTFNAWMGCTKVSPACDHCYAERDTKRFGRVEWGAGKPRVRTSPANWKQPERWNREKWVQCSCGWRGAGIEGGDGCGACGKHSTTKPARRRVFCASLADWLDNEVPIEWLVDLLDLIRRTPNLDWLLLTKRIGNLHKRLGAASIASRTRPGALHFDGLTDWIAAWLRYDAPDNVWLGASVVNQDEVNRDVPKLLAVPARVRFLSIEPMLGPINLDCWPVYGDDARPLLHWIIAGGESGPHARPMQREWVRSLRDQCAAAGVPFLFKQWGEWAPNWLYADDGISEQPGSMWMDRIGKKSAGRTLDGQDHNGFPVP